ncbi:MAG TPA: hypothetical protein VGD59_02725 [Acidisarcina sp.]
MWNNVGQSLEESMDRVVNKIAQLLPAILAFVLALLLSALIGWLLALLVRRVLTAMKFDRRVSSGSTSIAEWSPNHTPTSLVSRSVFWGCIVIGILIGLTAFDASYDSSLAPYILAYVPKVVGAIVLLFVGSIVARFLSRSVLIGAVNMKLQYASLLATGVKWLVLVLTTAMVLDHLAIGGLIVDLAFGILFGGIVLALALAVGLGSRDLVSRSLEREVNRPLEQPLEEKLHHF